MQWSTLKSMCLLTMAVKFCVIARGVPFCRCVCMCLSVYVGYMSILRIYKVKEEIYKWEMFVRFI